MQAIVSKNAFPQSGMLSSLLNLFQSLMEIHPDFYDPIEIQLEGTFQDKVIINKLFFISMLAIDVHFAFRFSFLSLIILVFLLLMKRIPY